MYIFCPLTKTFNDEESRPLIIPHEYFQPIEVPILEFIHNTKYNHKYYNLIQNTPHEIAVGTEELKTTKHFNCSGHCYKLKTSYAYKQNY